MVTRREEDTIGPDLPESEYAADAASCLARVKADPVRALETVASELDNIDEVLDMPNMGEMEAAIMDAEWTDAMGVLESLQEAERDGGLPKKHHPELHRLVRILRKHVKQLLALELYIPDEFMPA